MEHRGTVWRMGREDGVGVMREQDVTRALVPFLAAGVVVLAVATDAGTWWQVSALVAAASLFFVWSRRDMHLGLLAFGVVVGTSLSQWFGALEPGMFLLSLLAVVLTGWHQLRPLVVVLVVLTMATPLVVMALQGEDAIGGPIWVLGIAFPACMGWAFHRQEMLSAELEQTRRQLAEQAVLEERRRIARDVHDLVGHGLAAMMLQVTSARHVLNRDPQAADDALSAAEDAGRRSMRELRGTVALLREGDSAVAPPSPSLIEIAGLVDAARGGGLSVEYRVAGDQQSVDPVVGLTLYRIAQEALANAGHHSPQAAHVVAVTVTDPEILLEVESRGSIGPSPDRGDADRPRYGVRGMQERAEVVSGDLHAGPTPAGWLVRCRVPLVGRSAAPVSESAHQGRSASDSAVSS